MISKFWLYFSLSPTRSIVSQMRSNLHNSSKKHNRTFRRKRNRLLQRLSSRSSLHELRLMEFESLERRNLLAINLDAFQVAEKPLDDDEPAAFSWFTALASAPRVSLSQLLEVDRLLPPGVAGPKQLSVGEWIVQLNDTAAGQIRSLEDAEVLLNHDEAAFTVLGGLGKAGSLLVQGKGLSKAAIERSLATNTRVASFHLNQLLQGQATLPDDPEYQAGLMTGLQRINTGNAWDQSLGSLSTVVGVVDTGIDVTHPDLYLNVWLNQGELPRKFTDDVGAKLSDIDGDGLITFYDLNNVTRSKVSPFSLIFGGYKSGDNAAFVVDANEDGRIDAIDLLQDPNWADGRDNDLNGFADDFFGVNFRIGDNDGLDINRPIDPLGHGTHVAGTIGAIGGNNLGVVGVNWQTSLMSLRILDSNNQGDSASAIRAINYATSMRQQLRTDATGRVTKGANVRVLNNSWGQPGGFESSLQAAIEDGARSGVLFVAAAGNGNFFGQGVDNDRTPFYPASYDVSNVVAVAASDGNDRLAGFSNYGATSVDIMAPGVSIRSTLPGGAYGSSNGTSMAAPHVAGTAALIWSAFPEATMQEVRDAMLAGINPIASAAMSVLTGGRLNASRSMIADVFAPSAKLIAKQDVTSAGSTRTEFTVQYQHRSGIDASSIGDDDLMITRAWGEQISIPLTLKAGSVTTTSRSATATYEVLAPGGTWDARDFGQYLIATRGGNVRTVSGGKLTEDRQVGAFEVRIVDPSVLYVTSAVDSLAPGTLRSAVIAANAASPAARTIILEAGEYGITRAPIADPTSTFGQGVAFTADIGGWSNSTTGDFDIHGNITIIGSDKDSTIISGRSLDRLFKVHLGATLNLQRIAIENGVSRGSQGGGAIISRGNVQLDDVIVRRSSATGGVPSKPSFGGGISAVQGELMITRSWITQNSADYGGAIYIGRQAIASISSSTLDQNHGGAYLSISTSITSIENSTFSNNSGGLGAISSGLGDLNRVVYRSHSGALSSDGRYLAFSASVHLFVPGKLFDGIFLYDKETDGVELVSINNDGDIADSECGWPTVSEDGRFVAFTSIAANLTNTPRLGAGGNVFVRDRLLNTTTLISKSKTGESDNGGSLGPSISADGRVVAFTSNGTNLSSNDSNNSYDVFIYDASDQSLINVSGGILEIANHLNPSISADGNIITFTSISESSGRSDVHVYDRTTGTIERIKLAETSLVQPSISGNGRFVSFVSRSLLDVLSNLYDDEVYVYDRLLRSYTLVTQPITNADQLTDIKSQSISENGRYIVFATNASNLVPGDDDAIDVYLYDRELATMSIVTPAGLAVSGVHGLDLSTDGGVVAIDSNSTSRQVYLVDLASGEVHSTVPMAPNAVTVHSSTVAYTSGADSALSTNVFAKNTLFFENRTFRDASESGLGNISLIGVSQMEPMRRIGNHPPVYVPRFGNPAINAASFIDSPTLDQLSNTRTYPDVGAIEVLFGNAVGRVYADLNDNGIRDDSEPGLESVAVRLGTIDSKGEDITIRSQSTSRNVPETVDVDELGTFEFSSLLPSAYTIEAVAANGWETIQPNPTIVQNQFQRTNSDSLEPHVSGDGRFVVFRTDASNLSPGDTNGEHDVFLFDRDARTIEILSEGLTGVPADGDSFRPKISGNGTLVLFLSSATNLVTGDTNGQIDLFLYDRSTRTIENLTLTLGLAFSGADDFSVSDDGRYIKIRELRYDRTTRLLESSLVSCSPLGLEKSYCAYVGSGGVFLYNSLTGASTLISNMSPSQSLRYKRPQVSNNEAAVVFVRETIHANGFTVIQRDLLRYDISTGVLSTVAVGIDVPTPAFAAFDDAYSLSSDGNFVVFPSTSMDYDLRVRQINDPRKIPHIYVYDFSSGAIALASVDVNGTPGNHHSFTPAISGDGRSIVFRSISNNLVTGDTNSFIDVFIVPNPLKEPANRVELKAGQSKSIDIGLRPISGAVSGRIFEDLVANGVYDQGETLLKRVQVFLDLNANGIQDPGEASTFTDDNGKYAFSDVNAFRSYSIVAVLPGGFEQVTPASNERYVWSIFLPAGGTIEGRDFALRKTQTTGQSTESGVTGRLYDDRDGDGDFDPGIDLPLKGLEVYLETHNIGVRDSDEVRVVTDADGIYTITDLPASTAVVATTLDETMLHVSPLGNKLQAQAYPLFNSLRPFSNPQSAVSADFNNDDYLDVAVALGEANKLSIRLNDGRGGFLPQEIDVDLGSNGAGPTSLVVGQFDNDPRLDVALTANLAWKVIILSNFDATSRAFQGQTVLNAGFAPVDLVLGQFGGDSKSDVAVLNRGFGLGSSSVQLFINNGNGVFTASAAINTGGLYGSSISAGDFVGDSALDVAVVNAYPGSSNGTVVLFRGNGAGSLMLEPQLFFVGAVPIESVAADFNGDGRTDLAVSNAGSNSITLLLGQAAGSLRIQTTTLGTAKGAYDLAVGDLDNDDDIDLLASNIADRNFSIFRNSGIPASPNADVQFEPLQSVGLADGLFLLAQRMPIVVGNFDNPRSMSGNTGTLDIVTVAKPIDARQPDTLYMLKNQLINGNRRVALNGSDIAQNLDFIIKPAVLPPSIQSIANPLPILEDSASISISLSGIVPGRAGGPALRITAQSSQRTVIAKPAIQYTAGATTASLTLNPVRNANGTSVITVTVTDAGADRKMDTVDDGVTSRSFTVTVLPVNDPPKFNVPSRITVNQKAGATALVNFVTQFGQGGGADEASQLLSIFTVTAEAGYFAVPPAIDRAGKLTFTPNPNNSGVVPVTVSLGDNGGSANGGNSRTTKTFLINILPVNDRPTFDIGPNQQIQAGSLRQVVPNFTTNFAPGGGIDESDQLVAGYEVFTSAPSLFAELPTIDKGGTLRYRPSTSAAGIAKVNVRVRDSGGTLNGGIDTSVFKSFSINVLPIPDTVRPLPTITSSVGTRSVSRTLDMNVSFSEIVTGFTLSDIAITNGVASNLRNLGQGRFVFTVSANSDGAVTVDVPQNVVADRAGNLNDPARSLAVTVDTVAPSLVFKATTGNPTESARIAFTVTFSEPVTGFELTDLFIVNGTLSEFTRVNGRVYTAIATASAPGLVTIGTLPAIATDIAGNGNQAATTLQVLFTPPTPPSGEGPHTDELDDTIRLLAEARLRHDSLELRKR